MKAKISNSSYNILLCSGNSITFGRLRTGTSTGHREVQFDDDERNLRKLLNSNLTKKIKQVDGMRHLPRVPGGRWIKKALLSKCARGRMKIRRSTRVMCRECHVFYLIRTRKRRSRRRIREQTSHNGKNSKKKPLSKCAAVYNYIYGRPNSTHFLQANLNLRLQMPSFYTRYICISCKNIPGPLSRSEVLKCFTFSNTPKYFDN